ncbi:hypothetical protein SNE40_001577 [Patella caerulea]|uniref:Uncharacterized protein n=1 Tax=Patella caerulea TaxID=87958 RepID=A0AAN8QI65_PATCE
MNETEAVEYMEAVMSPSPVPVVVSEDTIVCKPSAAKKLKVSNVNEDSSSNSSNSDLMVAMKEMRTFLAAEIVESKKRMAANLRNIMREETAELRSDFEKKITELSKKLKSTEKAHDKDINNVKSDIGKLSGKVCEMERTISEEQSRKFLRTRLHAV